MSEDWKIQVSPKTPSGTLINIRGNTPEEVQELLGGVQELVTLVVGLEQSFAGVHNAAPLSTGPSTQIVPDQPSTAQGFPSTPPVTAPPSNPAASGPTCMHGARKYITGTKNGKTWAMWACPTPKDAPDKCSPQWA